MVVFASNGCLVPKGFLQFSWALFMLQNSKRGRQGITVPLVLLCKRKNISYFLWIKCWDNIRGRLACLISPTANLNMSIKRAKTSSLQFYVSSFVRFFSSYLFMALRTSGKKNLSQLWIFIGRTGWIRGWQIELSLSLFTYVRKRLEQN
jgi:hypothetical protein